MFDRWILENPVSAKDVLHSKTVAGGRCSVTLVQNCTGTVIKLGTFSTDMVGKLNIFGHNGHALGTDGTKIDIFKETHDGKLP